MKIHSIISTVLSICSISMATYQRGDFIEYNSHVYRIGEGYALAPLELYFHKTKTTSPKRFSNLNSNLWRGHVAHWRICDDKMWLIAIYDQDKFYCSMGGDGPMSDLIIYPLDKIFPDEGPLVYAEWFTGKQTLRIRENDYGFGKMPSDIKANQVDISFRKGKVKKPKQTPSSTTSNSHNSITESKAGDRPLIHQRGDYVEYKSHVYRIDDGYRDTPLEVYFKDRNISPPLEFKSNAPDLWRGHLALWRIQDNKLWLTAIYIQNEFNYEMGGQGPMHDLMIYPIEKLFPNQGPVIHADWFSGALRLGVYRADYETNRFPGDIKKNWFDLSFNKGELVDSKQDSNQQVDPIVTTPVDKVEEQSTQGHP